MQNGHSSALEAKHAGLEQRITAETKRPNPDPYLVAELKKQKPKIKEEIIQFQ